MSDLHAWNLADKAAGIALSANRLVATGPASGGGDHSVRSVDSHASGQYYLELTILAGLADISVGFCTAAMSLTTWGGSDTTSVGFFPNSGSIYHNGAVQTPTFTVGAVNDVIGLWIDRGFIGSPVMKVAARINGGNWNALGTVDPATGANVLDLGATFATGAVYVFFNADGTIGSSVSINLGNTPFAYPPPNGAAPWRPWDLSGLNGSTTQYATPAIAKPPYLVPYIDQTFKNKVTRVTGDQGTSITGLGGQIWGSRVHHGYGTIQVWNCDQSMMYIGTNAGGACTAATVVSGGTAAWAVNDHVTLANGVVLNVSTVSGGVITGVTVLNGGNFDSQTAPSNPQSMVSHTGVGTGTPTFNLTWVLGTGGIFIHGQTYAPLYTDQTPNQSTSDVRWDSKLKNIMRVIGAGAGSNQYGTYDVTTGIFTSTRTFTGYSIVRYGGYKGSFALDGETVVLDALRASDSKRVIFKYHAASDTKGSDVDTTLYGTDVFSSAKISPLGDYCMITYNDDSHAIIRLSDNVNVGNVATTGLSHQDLILGADGVQYAVGRGPSGGNAVKTTIPGLVSTTVDSSGGYCESSGARAQNIKRYFVSNYNDNRPTNQPLEDEIVMFDFISPTRYRLCHTHSAGNAAVDYDVSAIASMSPDAGRVVFCSPWDNPAAVARPGSLYVVDIRGSGLAFDWFQMTQDPTPDFSVRHVTY